ncbi:hypothetical protein LP420_07000 [Massilia sp. B-10]|nr:hypothetical protein LP420_07000 [Massilia sp. B-10]UUZ55389.1 hypothetical protein LP419_06545 [Massilia sp. H-1]
METTIDYLALLCMFILGFCVANYAALTRLTKRLGQIETAMGIETELERAANIAPDVEEKIKAGKINQAIKLHRSRYDISLGEAQLIIKKHAANMA